MCLKWSQNYQLDVHIYFTYLLFRSKEIIYLCQEKSEIPTHTKKENKHTTAPRQWCGIYSELAATALVRNSGSLLWHLSAVT